jgi:hypothetical protein
MASRGRKTKWIIKSKKKIRVYSCSFVAEILYRFSIGTGSTASASSNPKTRE